MREGRGRHRRCHSFMVQETLRAAESWLRKATSVEIIDPRTLVPLDIDTILASVHKTGRLLIVDEDYAPCGAAAEIAAQVMDRAVDDLDAPVRRINGVFAPTPFSPAFTISSPVRRRSRRPCAICWTSEAPDRTTRSGLCGTGRGLIERRAYCTPCHSAGSMRGRHAF